MLKILFKNGYSYWFRLLCWIVILTFGINVIGEDVARAWSVNEPQNIIIPPVGMLMPASPAFSLPTLKAISIDPNDPFKINFVVDTADQGQADEQEVLQEQINLLVKYFLSFLTIPEEELWVNLSPYEKDRIITSEFEITNAGRDMLAQDYILKQLAASLTYPEHELGKTFWKKVFDEARDEYGTTDVPINAFNKVWVVPDKAVVYEANGSAFISTSHLKVLTEEDYLSTEKHSNTLGVSATQSQGIDKLSSEITREILIPELEREVNKGKYFAPLRQMYSSLILAIWFKKRYKEHLIGQIYVDQKKTSGISLNEKQIKEKIYAQYLKAYKKGVYNYIKEEEDPVGNEIIPRKYFSGGFSFAMTASRVTFLSASKLTADPAQIATLTGKGLFGFTVNLIPLGGISKQKLMSLAAGVLLLMGGAHQAHAETSTILEKSYNDVKSIDVVNLHNARVMNKLEKAEKVFEIIQPGQAGYALRESVLTIYKIMNDPQLGDALSKMPTGGRAVYTYINDTPEGRYLFQKEGELKAAEKELKLLSQRVPILKRTVPTPPIVLPVVSAATLKPAPPAAEPVTIPTAAPKAIPLAAAPAAVPAVVPKIAPAAVPAAASLNNHGGAIPPNSPPATYVPPTVTSGTSPHITMISPIIVFASTKTPLTILSITSPTPITAPPYVPQVSLTQNNVQHPTVTIGAPPPPPKNIVSSTTTSIVPQVGATQTNAQPTTVTIGAPPPPPPQNVVSSNILSIVLVKNGQETGSPNHVSMTGSATPFLGQIVADNQGIVTNYDPALKKYKQGDHYLTLYDQAKTANINYLTNVVNISTTNFIKLEELHKQGAATDEELDIARLKFAEFSWQLAVAKEEEVTREITAPRDLTIPDIQETLLHNGTPIKTGDVFTSFLDDKRSVVSFEGLSPSVNYFNRFQDFTVDNKKIDSIVNVSWSPDPSWKFAQGSFDLTSESPIPFNTQVTLQGTFSPPLSYFPDLNIVSGPQAAGAVSRIGHYVINSPADGRVIFKVRERQEVQEGEVVAVVENIYYEKERKSIQLALNSVNDLIHLAFDKKGVQLKTGAEMDSLYAQQAKWKSELEKINFTIDSLQIHATANGIVRSINAYESQEVRTGTELITIDNSIDTVRARNATHPILFSNGLNIGPVVVVTPQGVVLPGWAILVDHTPNSTKNLNGYQELKEVRVYDDSGILDLHEGVTIKLPKNEQQKQEIISALAVEEGDQGLPANQAMMTSLKGSLKNIFLSLSTAIAISALGSTQTQNIDSNNSSNTVYTLDDIEARVRTNLAITREKLNVLMAKRSEKLPKAKRLTVFGAPVLVNGHIEKVGGLWGTFAGAGAGAEKGSALGPVGIAEPVIFTLAGDIVPFLTGKVSEETREYQELTKVASAHLQTVINTNVFEAQRIAVDIVTAKNKIEELQKLQDALQISYTARELRRKEKIDSEFQVGPIKDDISDTTNKIYNLQNKVKNWTLSLNRLIGGSNTNSDMPGSFTISLPAVDFPLINGQTESNLLAKLIGTNSPDPWINEAEHRLAVIKQAQKNKKAEGYARVQITGINAQGDAINPAVGVSPNQGVTGYRDSSLHPGNQGAVGFQYDLVNTGLKTEKGLLADQRQQDYLGIEIAKEEGAQELRQALNTMNHSSEQVDLEKQELLRTSGLLDLKVQNPGAFGSYDRIIEIKDEAKAAIGLLDYQAEYLKMQLELKKLGLPPNPAQLSINHAQLSQKLNWKNLFGSFLPYLLLSFTVPAFSQPNIPEENPNQFPPPKLSQKYSESGGVHYNNIADPSSAWFFMHSTSDSITNQDFLIRGSGVFDRKDNLDFFLSHFQNNTNFTPILRYNILNSPYPDAIDGILQFMSQQPDYGIEFLIQIAQEAATKNNQTVIRLCIQSLKDIFTRHPEAVKRLSASFKDDTPATKLFLTLLLTQQGSPAAESFWEDNNLWNTDDLIDIYNWLTGYANSHPGEAGIKDILHLAEKFKAQRIRIQGEGNMPWAFAPAGFSHITFSPNASDVITARLIAAYQQANLEYLRFSPDWSRTIALCLNARVYSRSLKEVNTELGKHRQTKYNVRESPIYQFSDWQNTRHDELEYPKRLMVDDLTGYVNHLFESKDFPELARLLAFDTPLRPLILKYLMDDSHLGIFLALDADITSTDLVFHEFIRSGPLVNNKRTLWPNTLMLADLRGIDNAGKKHIVREALLEFYQESFYKNPDLANWAKWMYLNTYNIVDVSGARGPNDAVEYQIERESIEVAVNAYIDKMGLRPTFVAGNLLQLQTQPEIKALYDLWLMLLNEPDSEKVVKTLDKNAEDYGGVFIKVRKYSREIIPEVRINNQSVSWFTTWGDILIATGGIWALSYWGQRRFQQLSYKKMLVNSPDALEQIISDKIRNSDDFHAGDITYEPPSQAMIASGTVKDRILRKPEDGIVHSKTLVELTKWWEQLHKWKNNGPLPNDQIVEQFHAMTEETVNILCKIPYEAKMMESVPGIYQNTLFYVWSQGGLTLKLLQQHLKGKKFTDEQQRLLDADIKKMDLSIKYTIRFMRILHRRTSINKVWTRTLPASHWMERSGLYKFARWFLYFEQLYNESAKGIFEDLPFLFKEGNSLIPGLYPNSEQILINSRDILNEVKKRGGMSDAWSEGSNFASKIGNFWREIKYPLIAISMIFGLVVSTIFGVTSDLIFAEPISVGAIFGIAFSWWHYAKPNWIAMDLSWSTFQEKLLDLRFKALENILGVIPQLSPSLAQLSSIEQSTVQVNLRRGGIDLSKVKDSILFKQKGNTPFTAPNTHSWGKALMTLKSFKGFDFQVIQYQPISNLKEFLLGFSSNRRGAWKG